jgi:hypothetical protein
MIWIWVAIAVALDGALVLVGGFVPDRWLHRYRAPRRRGRHRERPVVPGALLVSDALHNGD